MKYTATCPSCGHETSIVKVLIAMTPFSFKCSNCKTRIYIRGIMIKSFLLMLIGGSSAIIVLRWIFDTNKVAGLDLLYFLIPAAIILFFEFIRGMLVCNKASLESRT